MTEKQLIKLIDLSASKIKFGDNINSTELLDELRMMIFIPKQKISVIRRWFALLATVKLTDDELKIIKKIIVKPKSSEWSIISKIVEYQYQLSGDQIVEWFSYIKPYDKLPVSTKFIKNEKVNNDELKIELFKNMLDHYNYQTNTIDILDEEMGKGPLWSKLLKILIDTINENDERSKRLAQYWVDNTLHLDIHTREEKLFSPLLYELTEKNIIFLKKFKMFFYFD